MLAISLSENEFKWLRKKNKYEKWLAIRVYSHSDEVLNLSKKFDEQFENVIITYFTDITKPIESDGKLFKPFGMNNYKEVINFVNEHYDCDKLFIHCHAGVCRSAGIAVGLSDKYDCDKLFIHCHAGVCRSAGIAVGLSDKYDWIEVQHGLNGDSLVYPYPNVVSWFKD